MALERISEFMKEGLATKAIQLTDQASTFLREGNVDAAITAMDEARETMGKVKSVNEATDAYLVKLAAMGIEQPSLDIFVSDRSAIITKTSSKAPISEAPQPEITRRVLPQIDLQRLAGVGLPVADSEGKRTRDDLPVRQERIAYALFAINDERTGFVSNEELEAIYLAYKDDVDTMFDEDAKLARTRGFISSFRIARDKLIAKLWGIEENPNNVLPVMTRLLGWLNSQKEYEDLSIEDLIKVVKRQVSFDELSNLAQENQTKIVSAEPENPSVGSVEIPQRDRQEEKRSGDLTERETNIANALLAINVDRNGFQYGSRREVAELVYKDSISRISDPRERDRKILSHTGNIYTSAQNVVKKLESSLVNPDLPRERIKDLWTWINEQPEYAGKSIDVIRDALMRKITFQELLQLNSEPIGESVSSVQRTQVATENPNTQAIPEQETLPPVDPELSDFEIYSIARRLQQIDAETLETLGINLPDEDKSELAALVEKYNDNILENQDEGEMLLRKLSAFTKDKQMTFMANLSNEDAQYLLALIASLDDEEKVMALLGINQ